MALQASELMADGSKDLDKAKKMVAN